MRPPRGFGRTDFSFPAPKCAAGTPQLAPAAPRGRDLVFALKFPGRPGKISLPRTRQNFICETLVH